MMTTHNVLCCFFSALVMAVSTAVSHGGQQADVHSFDAPDGETYYAIVLPGEALSRPAAQHVEHVVLFDTSASQMGPHRQYGLAVLENFLQALPAGDRVTLYALDVDAVSMSGRAVSPADAVTDGLATLKTRFPAGSTNMVAGLEAALETLSGGATASVLYIGDGMSTAHLVQQHQMHELLDQFITRHIPVHTFAVGPNQDRQMLGILSHHTGGRALRDDGSSDPGDLVAQAREMAAATRVPVFYPERIDASPRIEGLLAERLLPVRPDQEVIYLGRGVLPQSARLTLTGTLADTPLSHTWSLAPANRQAGHTFLYGFYRQAVRDGGLNPLAGMKMFRGAQQAFEGEIARLEAVGEQAIAAGDLDQAEQVGLMIKRVDPQNVRAEALIGAAGTLKVSLVAQNQPVAQPEQVPALPSPPDQLPPAEFPAPPDELAPREGPIPESPIEQAERLRTIRGQRLAAEINQVIADSQRRMADDPAGVEADLESALATVKAATDVDPDLQNQLLRRVTTALIEVQNRREVLEARIIAEQRRRAEAEARAAVISAEEQAEQRLAQMVEQIRALVYEGWQGNPDAFEEAEALAREVESNEPGAALGTQTVLWTEAAGHLDKSYRLRSLRADKFLATLHQVELSHVPFPDEPPVVYPPAPVWRRLTEERREWRISVDLHEDSPNERKIYDALEQDTSMEFVDTPLSEAIQYISNVHGITILIDEAELVNVGLATDEPVNLVISDISLRSALKLLLEPLELTWVVADEVMKITTTEKADTTLQTRVYPVGDLVISPTTMIGNVGGGGGLGGGLGGFGGGLGGGGFGGGLGGGIGGGGFGGGGFFSVTDTPPKARGEQPFTFDNEAIDRLKKKPVHAR